MSHRVPPSSPNGKLRIVSCPRVTASRISIVALNLPQAIAMNLLHGDHTAMSITEGNFMVAIVGSHDTGTPCTILTKGCADRSYNLSTVDAWGDSGRAER